MLRYIRMKNSENAALNGEHCVTVTVTHIMICRGSPEVVCGMASEQLSHNIERVSTVFHRLKSLCNFSNDQCHDRIQIVPESTLQVQCQF